MRRAWLVTVAAIAVACCGPLFGQTEAPKTRLFFGPFIGATAMIVSESEFDSAIEAVYGGNRGYFPVFTQMGIEAMQLIPAGGTKNLITFHEMFSLGGLDQNMPIPSLTMLLGYRFSRGPELGLGPYFTLMAPSGSVRVAASVAYAIGWTIAREGFSMPITLSIVPLPSYTNPQISVLIGFSFESLE